MSKFFSHPDRQPQLEPAPTWPPSVADFEAAVIAATDREAVAAKPGPGRRRLRRPQALLALVGAIRHTDRQPRLEPAPTWRPSVADFEAAVIALTDREAVAAKPGPGRRRLRRLQALLALVGVILVVVGSFSMLNRAPDLGPGTVALSTEPPASIPPLISAFPSDTPAPTPAPSAIPSDTPTPAPTPTPVTHTATRIVFTRARVDLPIITAPANESFPYCDVAERMDYYSVPGAGWVTYLYAHATHYMFGGLLAASWQPDAYLLGQQIQIYTSDDLVYTYAVTEIHRHVAYTSFDIANNLVGEALILQACENNDATGPKLIVVARPVRVETASHAAAHPPTAPRACAHGY